MSDDDFDDDRSFLQRNRVLLCILAVLLTGAGVLVKNLGKGHGSPPPKVENLATIKLVPPLPPPPPPPPAPPRLQEPPPQDQKMVEQTPVNEPELKPDPAPKDEPPAPLGTNIAGPGNDGFGLGRSGNGGGSGLGGSGAHSGSRWGWYAGGVQTRIMERLRENPKTRKAAMRTVVVRIWPDSTGLITQARLSGSTGDPAVDKALETEVLTGMRLQSPPPADMPRPIVLRLSTKRSN